MSEEVADLLKTEGSGSRSKVYKATGVRYPSLTEILDAYPKAALTAWKLKMVAQAAVKGDCGDDMKCLVAAPERIADATAKTGTAVHEAIAMALLDGKVATEDDLPSREAWKLFEKWLVWREKAKPEVILCETALVNQTLGLCGSCDLVAQLRGVESGAGLWICDWKRSAQVRPTYALQASGYRHMEFYVDDKNDLQPMPEITRGGILLLGSGKFEEVQCDAVVFSIVKSLLRIHKIATGLEDRFYLGAVAFDD